MLHFFAKRLRDIQEVRRDERGFTLIELLVVVIIIGILAAIAIPVFLNQRERAWEASTKSDVRNAVTVETAMATQGGGLAAGAYKAGTANERVGNAENGFVPSQGVTITVGTNAAGEKTIAGTHDNLPGESYTYNTVTGKYTSTF